MNFLTADGNQFAHPLHHLGKTKKDLPLIAIDSFRHMYLFPGKFDMKFLDWECIIVQMVFQAILGRTDFSVQKV